MFFFRSCQGFMHMKFSQSKDGRYILGQNSPPFDTIPEVVHYYTTHKLPIKGAEHLSLLFPVLVQTLWLVRTLQSSVLREETYSQGICRWKWRVRHNQQQHTLTFWSHVFNCTTASGWGHQLLKWNMSDQIIVRSVHMLFHFFNNTFRDLLLVFSRCYSPLGRCISRPNVYWSISSLLGWADGPLYFYSCCKRHLNIDVYDYPLFKVCKAFWL